VAALSAAVTFQSISTGSVVDDLDWDIADFIEKQGAAVGQFEATRLILCISLACPRLTRILAGN